MVSPLLVPGVPVARYDLTKMCFDMFLHIIANIQTVVFIVLFLLLLLG